jgi:site-specific recombinase XerD
MRRDLPRRVHVSGRWYWHVRAAGVKRIWEKLSLVADGMPALHAALSRFLSVDECPDGMPMLIADWLRDVSARHAPHTQGDERRRCAVIAARFAEFQARQVTAPDVAEFLNSYTDKPRTHNAYRSLVRELMRYAILRGYRTDNPVEGVIRTMRTPARSRYITDSEMRRIKVASLRGDDRKRTRTGVMMCCLIEMAYLTAGDVGVLIRMLERRDSQQPTEPHVHDAGLFLQRDKTGKAINVTWTPRLRAVVAMLRKLKAERLLKVRAEQRVMTPYLFSNVSGRPMTYSAVREAWQDAIRRSRVAPAMFRDIRAKALTDKEASEGMQAARAMGTHSTEQQTSDYVRRTKPGSTGATR